MCTAKTEGFVFTLWLSSVGAKLSMENILDILCEDSEDEEIRRVHLNSSRS